MKKIPVSECPAGPELDTAVAKAMGWKQVPGEYDHWIPPDFDMPVVRSWSTDANSVSELICQIIGEGWHFGGWFLYLARSPKLAKWECWMSNSSVAAICDGKTQSLAISRVYLLAKGVEYVEVPE